MCFFVPAGRVEGSPATVDLTGVTDPQGSVQLVGDHGSSTAVAPHPHASHSQRLPAHVAETAVTPSKPAVLSGRTLGSPASPLMSLGKKQKQADIRGFMSPKSARM